MGKKTRKDLVKLVFLLLWAYFFNKNNFNSHMSECLYICLLIFFLIPKTTHTIYMYDLVYMCVLTWKI